MYDLYQKGSITGAFLMYMVKHSQLNEALKRLFSSITQIYKN